MTNPKFYMVFDVESVGLHGEGFAVGWVVVTQSGFEVESGLFACNPANAKGDDAGRRWVAENVRIDSGYYMNSPAEVRSAFWSLWRTWAAKHAVLVADCAWPVEARFLAACVDDDPEQRSREGPYPLHDLASMRLLAGFDPLATEPRRPDELPIHNPLADARQSARLLAETFVSQIEVDADPEWPVQSQSSPLGKVMIGEPKIRPKFHVDPEEA